MECTVRSTSPRARPSSVPAEPRRRRAAPTRRSDAARTRPDMRGARARQRGDAVLRAAENVTRLPLSRTPLEKHKQLWTNVLLSSTAPGMSIHPRSGRSQPGPRLSSDLGPNLLPTEPAVSPAPRRTGGSAARSAARPRGSAARRLVGPARKRTYTQHQLDKPQILNLSCGAM